VAVVLSDVAPGRAGQMTKTVIIAVNDPNILYLLQRYAEESGFQPVRALQGNDLLNLLARHPSPALLILDVEFSEIADSETLRGLRAATAAHRVPIVLYSCLEEPDDEWKAGVAAYLPKSVMYDDFVGALKCAGLQTKPAQHS